jgi:hypothetical protein
MYVLFQIVAVTIFLLLTQGALRRANQWVIGSLFLWLPLALTPYWIEMNDLGPFPWFKFYTVFSCVSWGAALRFTSLGNRAWARSTIPLLLAANILEAVIVDLVGHGSAHVLNAAAGLLLIATLPYGDGMRIDPAGGYRDMLYGTSLRWVIGYTLWNWTFVYLNYPALAGHHVAVLAAALIVALLNPRRWLQTRAATLGVNLLCSATSFGGMIAWLDTSAWFDQQLAIVAAGCSFVFMAGHAVQAWLSRFAPVGERLNTWAPAEE